MRYLGSKMFLRCTEGEHSLCPNYDIVSESHPAYVDCACGCHEAAANGAWQEERDAALARRNEFIANVEQVFGGRIGP